MTAETVAIIGTSGRTGRALTKAALAERFRVPVFVRNPSKMHDILTLNNNEGNHRYLTVVRGSLPSDVQAMRETIPGAHYVFCVAGATGDLKHYPKKEFMYESIMMLYPLLEAEESVKTFVYQSGIFCVSPNGTPSMERSNDSSSHDVPCGCGRTSCHAGHRKSW